MVSFLSLVGSVTRQWASLRMPKVLSPTEIVPGQLRADKRQPPGPFGGDDIAFRVELEFTRCKLAIVIIDRRLPIGRW